MYLQNSQEGYFSLPVINLFLKFPHDFTSFLGKYSILAFCDTGDTMIHKVVRYAQGMVKYIPAEKGRYPVNEENI